MTKAQIPTYQIILDEEVNDLDSRPWPPDRKLRLWIADCRDEEDDPTSDYNSLAWCSLSFRSRWDARRQLDALKSPTLKQVRGIAAGNLNRSDINFASRYLDLETAEGAFPLAMVMFVERAREMTEEMSVAIVKGLRDDRKNRATERRDMARQVKARAKEVEAVLAARAEEVKVAFGGMTGSDRKVTVFTDGSFIQQQRRGSGDWRAVFYLPGSWRMDDAGKAVRTAPHDGALRLVDPEAKPFSTGPTCSSGAEAKNSHSYAVQGWLKGEVPFYGAPLVEES